MSKLVKTCLNLFKLVQTCSKLQYDKIILDLINLTQSDISKLVIMIWYDSTNMFRLVIMLWYDLIRFYKHVQTCHDIMIRFYKHVQTCPDLSWYYDTIWYDSANMSRFVYDTIWYNSTCVKYVWTCMTQSYSLDRFDKWAVKNFLKLNVLKSKNYCNRVMDYRLQHIGKWQIFQHKTEARRSSIVTNICYFCYFLCFKINFVFRLQPLTILVLSGFPAFWSTIRQH